MLNQKCCRKFAKPTYGLFRVDADWLDLDVANNLHDLVDLPLMLKAG